MKAAAARQDKMKKPKPTDCFMMVFAIGNFVGGFGTRSTCCPQGNQ
jgi:hypothetical protein